MKAIALREDRSLELVDLAEPPLAPGEVRVKVAYCGICGSDLHMSRRATTPAGHVMGHEFSGAVAELGSGVEGWRLGDRVAVLPMVPCGDCLPCRQGRIHLCERGLRRGPGLGRQGGYAESVAVPVGMLHRLPDNVSDRDGALVEPLAVALHGIALAEATPDAPTLVVGGGPIGLLTAVGLRLRGFESLLVVEPVAARRHKLESLGFETSLPEDAADRVHSVLGDDAPTLAFDCTGHPSGAPLAIGLMKRGSTLVVVGLPDEPSPIDLRLVGTQELRLIGSSIYVAAEFEEAIEYIAAGRVPCDEISRVADLSEAQHWFGELLSGATNEIKVLLKP